MELPAPTILAPLTNFLEAHPRTLLAIGGLLASLLYLLFLRNRYLRTPGWGQVQEQRNTEAELQELIDIEKQKP